MIQFSFIRELRREKTWSRLNLIPLLQAEADRDMVRRLEAVKGREAEYMKQIDGWSPLDLKAPVPGLGPKGETEPVYFTKRYVAPISAIITDEYLIEPQYWRGSRMFLRVNFILCKFNFYRILHIIIVLILPKNTQLENKIPMNEYISCEHMEYADDAIHFLLEE